MKNINRYDIVYDRSVKNWDEALPLGNGRIGALIYGDGPLRLALDRADLWDVRENPVTREKAFNYKNLVALVKSGKQEDWAEYERLFGDIYMSESYPAKLTACRLELDFGRKTENIRSKLSLKQAVAVVEAQDFKTESFLSATDFVGVMRIFGDYKLNFHTPLYLGEKKDGLCFNYPAAKIVKDGEFTVYCQNTATDYAYAVIVCEKRESDYTDMFFTVVTTEDNKDYIAYGKNVLSAAIKKGFESLKKSHVAWWKKYWEKSQISVPDEGIEKTYYRSWYLFASCSRKGGYPMALQGVWTADHDGIPPWKGDYHHDTNTELSYQAYLKANRLSEGEVFIDYLWNLKPTFENFAKEFYNVDGLLIPSCSTIDGKPMGGWPQYSLSPTMTIWAAQSFDEYYLYTGDEEFLKDRAYPFLSEVGEAIAGLLEEKNGKLYLPLSTSPEVFDDTRKAYLEPNSNFDLALLRYLYKTLDIYEKKLNKERKSKEILDKLDDIAIENGMVMLDKTQHLEKTHRHFSHLMCLYPLHLINYDTAEHKKIYDNSIFELEYLGSGMWTGFSFAMMAQIYAMAQKGNSAREKLYQFSNGFVAENGFHLNGDFKNQGYTTFHYRPFTLESSFGFCDALHEMLLQDHAGYMHLFPAIPDEWKKREVLFKNLRSRGGVLVDAEFKNGNLKEFTLKSKKSVNVNLKNSFGADRLVLSDGDIIECSADGIFSLSVKGELTCSIERCRAEE